MVVGRCVAVTAKGEDRNLNNIMSSATTTAAATATRKHPRGGASEITKTTTDIAAVDAIGFNIAPPSDVKVDVLNNDNGAAATVDGNVSPTTSIPESNGIGPIVQLEKQEQEQQKEELIDLTTTATTRGGGADGSTTTKANNKLVNIINKDIIINEDTTSENINLGKTLKRYAIVV